MATPVSYLTAAEADTLAATLPGLAAYKALATTAAKNAALLLASIDVDAAGPWQGRRYVHTQSLEFPRLAFDGGDGGGRIGADIRSPAEVLKSRGGGTVVWDLDPTTGLAVVPTRVTLAVLYQADSISLGDREGRLQAMADGLAGQAVGSVSETYKGVGAVGGSGWTRLAARAQGMMGGYRLRSGVML